MTTQPAASCTTGCSNQPLLFQDLGSRKVVADFSGGSLSSDGGALLLRQVDQGLGVSSRLAQCFIDRRDPNLIDHSVAELVRQRLFALALGYEDINDHQLLRHDPLMAVACEKSDPLGGNRLPGCGALAAPSTLNRLELSNNLSDRYHRIAHDPQQVQACLLTLGIRCLPKESSEIILDLDAMGHLLSGQQEGRNFHRYYDGYCYLPLYIFAGEVPLWAQLRTSDVDPIEGVVPALDQVLAALRKRCPRARVIVRGDCNFARDELMSWCEQQSEVYFCLGFARNSAVIDRLADTLADARAAQCLTGASSVRRFADFEYQTAKSWSHCRRIVGKAEVSSRAEDTRFVVTNLPAEDFVDEPDHARFQAQRLYEELYCARGEMENVLKQQVLDLKANRMSTRYLASNQLRLWLATLGYLLIERVRAIGCLGTQLARATAGSIRLKVLKIAAQVRVSVRRVYVQISGAYVFRDLFRLCQQRLIAIGSSG